jgi:glucose-6-phosphate 1-epimerase
LNVSTKSFELTTGKGGLPMLKIQTPWSDAEIYLHGAHVTHFQKKGEPPLLFLSRQSKFATDKAIRGGVPICYPWFGSRAGEAAAHGFARISAWEFLEGVTAPDGAVRVRLGLPQKNLKPEWAPRRTEFIVTAADTLTMELAATNTSPDKTLEIENCLHTYFHVGDITAIAIAGLQGATYLDNSTDGKGRRTVDNDPILKVTRETNRIYLDTTHNVEIRDEKLRRTVQVQKFNSHSTVVWNPWTTQKLGDDFDQAEHQNMVCVEAGNVKENKIMLSPNQISRLKVVISSENF